MGIEDILDDLHTCQQTNDCLGQILEGRLSGVEAKVEENTNNIIESSELISANAMDISSNTGDISEDKKAIQSNTQNLEVHWSKILENDEDISSNQVIIIESSELISANALHISSNTGAITDDKKAIQSNTQNIGTNSDHISTNTESIRTNTGDISTNAVSISTNAGAISTNAASISTNTRDISTDTESIKTNDGVIRTNTGAISTNAVSISTHTRDISSHKKATESNSQAIAALENSAFVGVCAYKDKTTSTGTLTYDSISSSFVTDSSALDTSSGTFTASTSGLYMVTWSAFTYGDAWIYLYKQGDQMKDAKYSSYQSDAADQGSETVMTHLCPGEEIYLGATENTDNIYRLQFCIHLAKEMPPC